MIYSWKNKIVTYGNESSNLDVSAGTTYTIPANTISYWNDATISGCLYVHRTADFRVKGTLTIASGGVIEGSALITGETAGTGAALSMSSVSSPDEVIPSTGNGANGSGTMGINAIKIMAKNIVNNGIIKTNGQNSTVSYGTGSGSGFIWIITEAMSGSGNIQAYGGAGTTYQAGSESCTGGYNVSGCIQWDGYTCDGNYNNKEGNVWYNTGCSTSAAREAGSPGASSTAVILALSTPSGGSSAAPTAATIVTTNWSVLSLGSIIWFDNRNSSIFRSL